MISMGLKWVFTLFNILILTTSNASNSVEKLPYCDSTNLEVSDLENLIFVSTLDGKVSALNAAEGGSLRWSLPTGPGPLLSSSIHNLELTNNGNLVRMIPSLSGGLYKFNGENLEPIPITADKLLKSSSFLFSDELVISGGRESRTYGVSSLSGEILYECSMNGCTNVTNENMLDGIDVILLQRQTQTVRAIEARTGVERWNFSVGQHELKLMLDLNAQCHSSQPINDFLNEIELKVIIPQGLICAVLKNEPNTILWKHKLEAPIVTAWRIFNKQIQPIDLFSKTVHWPMHNDQFLHQHTPSLYIGMHQKQLYIQESILMDHHYREMASDYITSENGENQHLIPWKPFPATPDPSLIGQNTIKDEEKSTTALSILYGSEYVNGNGFYLYSHEDLQVIEKGQCNAQNNETFFDEDEFFNEMLTETPVQIIIVSLWYYWKEVLVISVLVAISFHLAFTQLALNKMKRNLPTHSRNIIILEKRVTVSGPPMESPRETRISLRSRSDPGTGLPELEYNSRYLSDFQHITCLGKGGFGVVFEAKNRIDDRHYAIKRIALPTRQESRERVLREVKALAQLENQNIVRYFFTWVEDPPPKWQKEQDKIILSQNTHNMSSLGSHLYDVSNTTNGSQAINSESESQLSKSSSLYKPHLDDDDSSSHIVFANSEDEENETKSLEGIEIQCPPSPQSRRRFLRRPNSLELRSSLSETQSSSLPVALPTTQRKFLFIQMELCRKESLREWLVENKLRDNREIMNIFLQIVNAVHYVHQRGLIHRDLKPSNIFFSLDGQIKIGDFGLVTGMTEEDGRTPCKEKNLKNEIHTARVGTQLYMSPEQVCGHSYNYKVDIYSLGLIFFELITTFSTTMEQQKTLMDLRKNVFPKNFEKDNKQEYELLKMMLSHQPEKRPTTYGILRMPPLNTSIQEPATPIPDQWHFELPTPPRSRSFSSSGSKSSTSLENGWEMIDSQHHK